MTNCYIAATPNGRNASIMFAVLVGLFLWLSIASAQARTISGEVVGVIDGDTIVLLDRGHHAVKIRLAFIDAPERTQAYGTKAKQALSDKVFHQFVTVDVIDRDKYQRTVGRVWSGDTDINLSQLTNGYAWFYVYYAKRGQSNADYARYQTAEAAARKQGRGLWQGAAPQPPWVYRHGERYR